MSVTLPSSSEISSVASSSQTSLKYAPPSPESPVSQRNSFHSGSSSEVSLNAADEENVTITTSQSLSRKKKSQEDLQLLLTQTRISELAMDISEIQTRIFAIQELRHKSQSSTDSAGTSSIIDESLMTLDQRLEAASKTMKDISDTLQPLLKPSDSSSENTQSAQAAILLRKHEALQGDWEAVQEESDVLREELKEDKWLTVFRTVTDQADGMMSSLEKAVNRCQDFIWQVHRRGHDDLLSRSVSQSSLFGSQSSGKGPPTIEVFNSLLESFEAKKKHYMPATSKVLSIIDKGVQDRVTKNGETLRRHAESAQRWKNLRERITRTEAEMETAKKILLNEDQYAPSEAGSSNSGDALSKNGRLAVDSSRSRVPSTSSTISRSISPFRKFARKFTTSTRGPPVTPLSIKKTNGQLVPSSEPVPSQRRHRTSIFNTLRPSQPPTPVTPERPVHKHSQSLTPESSPRGASRQGSRTPSGVSAMNNTLRPSKPSWNSSVKIYSDEQNATIRSTPSKRSPSAAGVYGHTDSSQYKRSLSRSSMASSRPWSPVSSSIATSVSSHPPLPNFRPSSRAQTPHSQIVPPVPATPRSRPKTPSHIPAPAKFRAFSSKQSEGDWDDDRSMSARAFSPTFPSSGRSPSGIVPPPRPPSRSMIPMPSFQLSAASRPSSAMSQYSNDNSPSRFKNQASRAQTPEHALRAKVNQLPIYQGGARPSSRTGSTSVSRLSVGGPKLPPSSFRDNTASPNRPPSRSVSRSGAYTPSGEPLPLHEYIPSNTKDPLDVEVANIVNSIPHGLLVERVDPPLRAIPRDGQEIRAQYAFSNALAKKIITCRLTTLTKVGKTGPEARSKKVMVRVGGGWQELQFYILNRQGAI